MRWETGASARRRARSLRHAGVTPDSRMAEAIEIVASKRDADGRWALGIMHPEEVIAEPGITEGSPSRWNTLRAMRVLRWFEQPQPKYGASPK